MPYKYVETSQNSDDTFSYDIVGDFPATFRKFVSEIIANTNDFRVEFVAVNKCYGGWLGNKIEASKNDDDQKWYITEEKPDNLFNELADKKIIKCGANGGWGQMTYFCTFEEQERDDFNGSA